MKKTFKTIVTGVLIASMATVFSGCGQKVSDTSIQMNTYFMCMLFASIPIFLIFAIFQKQIMGGVNIGGVKG